MIQTPQLWSESQLHSKQRKNVKQTQNGRREKKTNEKRLKQPSQAAKIFCLTRNPPLASPEGHPCLGLLLQQLRADGADGAEPDARPALTHSAVTQSHISNPESRPGSLKQPSFTDAPVKWSHPALRAPNLGIKFKSWWEKWTISTERGC